MDNKSFKQLIGRYLDNVATQEEKRIIDKFLDSYWHEELNWQTDIMGDEHKVRAEILQKIRNKGIVEKSYKKQKTFRILWRVAASFIILAVSGYFLLQSNSKFDLIKPGKETAVLTLADGRVIILDETKSGLLASQGKIKIVKKDNQLIFDASGSLSDKQSGHKINTISTPRGGQFQVVLPDGSTAWLNAASSIKFPTSFSGKERRVEITGEVHFEVQSKSLSQKVKIPFIVVTEGLEVKVLGTHFNVNTYSDDGIVRTTLIEGSIEVFNPKTGGSQVILPGQQAQLSENGQINVIDVNLNEVIAWKNGNFFFNDTGIEVIMNSVARWYDVDIKYEGDVKELRFVGIVSRKDDIREILNIMAITGVVDFDIQGRTIVVKQKK